MGWIHAHEHECNPHELHQENFRKCVCWVPQVEDSARIISASLHSTDLDFPNKKRKKKYKLLQWYTLLWPPQHSEKAWSSRRQIIAAKGVMTPGDDDLVQRTLDLFDLAQYWKIVSLSNSIQIFCVVPPFFEMNQVTRPRL